MNEIKVTYLGQHYYEGNDSLVYLYLDENNDCYYIYVREADSDYELVTSIEDDHAVFQCGVAIDSFDLEASLNVIDYGYLSK